MKTMGSVEENYVPVSLPDQSWKNLIPLIENERLALLAKMGKAEGMYKEVLELKENELATALEEIELNLNLDGRNAVN